MKASSRVTLLSLGLLLLAGCGGGTAAPKPSPSPVPEVALPNFNSRLGSNRLAAVAAAAIGRKLYAGNQYWEVYVRTTPPDVPGRYDPGDPAASLPAATVVTAADVIMASESGLTIKAFGAAGDAGERRTLASLEAALRASFPALRTSTWRIFYGETFQHGTATFDHGRLVTYDVRAIG